MLTLEERVELLEQYCEKMKNVFVGDEAVNDVMQGRLVARELSTIRFANAKLVFPTVTDADLEARGADGVGVKSTLIAVDKNDEVKNAIIGAFNSAIEYGHDGGVLPDGYDLKKITQELNQSPFLSVSNFLSGLKGDTAYLEEMLEGKYLLRNFRVADQGERETRLLNVDGKLIDPSSYRFYNGTEVEIVISFAAYNKAGSIGVGRYIQGIRALEEKSFGPKSLYL